MRIAVTFVLVLVTWVFFRAADLPSAMRYLGHMVGLGSAHDGAALLTGIVYQPYYLGTFVARRDRHLGVSTDLGLDASPDRAESDRRRRPVRAGRRATDDAGLQPVHLFHLLMVTNTQSAPTREGTALDEVGHTDVSRTHRPVPADVLSAGDCGGSFL